jgi:hypothetical protein
LPTTLTVPVLPARFGTAVATMYATAQSLTGEQRDQLDLLLLDTPGTTWKPARRRLDDDDELHVLDELTGLLDEQTAVLYPILAVCAQDLGVITADDFAILTSWWVAAGLPLPQVATGDDETGSAAPIQSMTSDLICDELRSASHGTSEYGAVLALTGYNHGQLLAHPFVRRFIGRSSRDQSLFVDWARMTGALDEGESKEPGQTERDILSFATTLQGYGDLTLADDGGLGMTEDNLEALGYAATHTLEVNHLFTASPTALASRLHRVREHLDRANPS